MICSTARPLSRRAAFRLSTASFFSAKITRSAIAAQTNRNIAVGGVDGFAGLAAPSASKLLRSTGRARLYVHDYAWKRLDERTRREIVNAFAGSGSAWLELGEARKYPLFWDEQFQTYLAAGLSPDQAHINLITGSNGLNEAEWREYVDAGRSHGVNIIAPIFAPNNREWQTSSFDHPVWTSLKWKANYGGGLTIDAPPWYFLQHASGYKEFVAQEVTWCRSAGIQSTWIISPPRSITGDFLQETKDMLVELKLRDSLPDCYIIENYMASPPPGFPFNVGSDTRRETVMSTGLWLAQNY